MKKIISTVFVALLPLAIMAADINKIPVVGYIARNWSAIDSSYIEPGLYNISVQAVEQNNQETMSITTEGGVKFKVRSPFAASAGAGAFYSFLGTNLTFNIREGKLQDGTKKSQFALNIFSQLFNINFQYRQTGGDFRLKKMYVPNYGDFAEMEFLDGDGNPTSLKDAQAGENCAVKMFNIDVNYIWNHRKFSYPAAQSFGGCQLRSAGSLITGVAYNHYKITNDFGPQLADLTLVLDNAAGKTTYEILNSIINDNDKQKAYGKYICTTVKFSDINFNIGYAYNWVPVKNLLISGSATVSPAIKICSGDNHERNDILTRFYDVQHDSEVREQFVDAIHYVYPETDPGNIEGAPGAQEPYYNAAEGAKVDDLLSNIASGEAYNHFAYSFKKTIFDVNYSVRLAATWTNARWYAGAQFVLQHYRYHTNLYAKYDNTFYSLNFTVGLRLWRNSQFRKGGKYAGRYRDPKIF